jgi:transposase
MHLDHKLKLLMHLELVQLQVKAKVDKLPVATPTIPLIITMRCNIIARCLSRNSFRNQDSPKIQKWMAVYQPNSYKKRKNNRRFKLEELSGSSSDQSWNGNILRRALNATECTAGKNNCRIY